jgi:K+-sensing histidine kinase KdpD
MELTQIVNSTSTVELSHMSHEILNYISIIKNMNDIINKECCDNIYTDVINSSCNKIVTIMNTIINDGTTIKHDKLKSINLKNKIMEIINSYQIECDKQKLVVVVELDEINIHSDEVLLERILINLFQNSIKNSSKAGIIKITCKYIYPYIQIQINNSGAVYNYSDMEYKCIELTLCKKMINYLGGNMNISSNSSLSYITYLNIPIHPKLLVHYPNLKEC